MKKIQFIFSMIILLVPFIYTGIHWSEFPDSVPLHFNASGEADGFGSKGFVWLLPIVNVIIWLFMLAAYKVPQLLNMPYYNADNVTHRKIADRLLGWFQILISLFITILSIQTSFAALGNETEIAIMPIIFFLILLIVLIIYYARQFKKTR